MKIGIMGGTFNPVHTGHLLLAQTAYNEADLDKVMFLPNGISYMKKNTNVLKAAHRLKMVELAIMDNPAFFASDIEIKRAGNTYTCDTLLQLKDENPQNHYYFILGADSLFSIENWKNPQIIFENCTILAAVRDGVSGARMQEKCKELMARFAADIKLLPFPETDISSTEIRALCAKGKSIRYMVPEQVRMYIEENGLYTNELK